MPAPIPRSAVRDTGGRIDVPVAALTWLVGWLGANIIGLLLVSVSGASGADDAPIWALFAGQVLGWAMLVGAMVVASRREGTGRFETDYSVRFRPIDLVGVGVGVLTQLVLVPLVYWPLERIWPDTFTSDKLSENAKDLVDRAGSAGMVLLVLMVCVGAPIVEELVYRGLIQNALTNRLRPVVGWVVASVFFMLIHFRPVEYPGLLVAGLVFGGGLLLTGRIGPAVAAHVGFNVTGLILAL